MSTHARKISVVGLGYVGLPVAVAFGKQDSCIGFDINQHRIAELKAGHDSTLEVEPADLAAANITFTADPAVLAQADFHIVAVPTPIDHAKRPDMTPVLKASQTVGKVLKRGDIVVYESTVYPGATEEDCVPVLEQCSGLKCGVDFFVGYSPERINPGDKEHTFTKITKVVSGQTPEILEIVAQVYESVVTAGVHRAATIKVAESAKVIENTQRDLNIALMNELSLIFRRIGIDTNEVLEAAGTKWNFLKFRPGLVGGHCIGVDPYYLTRKAEQMGYHPQVILAGRRINDCMGKFVAEQTVKQLLSAGWPIAGQTVVVLGLTFKEDIPDLRNSKVIDVVRELENYGLKVAVHDPHADPDEARHEYGVELVPWERLPRCEAMVAAVPHRWYRQFPLDSLTSALSRGGVFADVKGQYDRAELLKMGYVLWRL
jgi:UDP-N-acetyl-D-galactosamine dehydrogenase